MMMTAITIVIIEATIGMTAIAIMSDTRVCLQASKDSSSAMAVFPRD